MNKEDYCNQKGENRFYVYIHRRLSDNKPFYVGKGTKNRAWRTDGRSKHWFNVVKKHGYFVEIVFDNLNENDSFQIEIDTILEFNYFQYPLVNLTSGGEGVCGYSPTLEHIENGRHARLNSQKWLDGVRITAEKLRGRPLSESHRKSISDSNKGRKISNSQKEKLSIIKKSSVKAMQHIMSLAGHNKDCTKYSFIKNDGSKFSGTREEFHNYTSIPKKEINKLFAKKNTRHVVYKWSLDVSNLET